MEREEKVEQEMEGHLRASDIILLVCWYNFNLGLWWVSMVKTRENTE